jgi:predicted transcriptional regulator
MKANQVSEVAGVLEGAGYRVLDCSGLRSCFDLIAKKDKLLFIKVLANVDGLTRRACEELQNTAAATSAVPLVVGDHTKSVQLQDGVVYERYNMRVLNLRTLEEVINEQMPSVYSVRGNYCIRVDQTLLVKLRKRLELTQQELAEELGVSKQTVHRYEFSGRMSREVAEKLMIYLEDDIALPEEVLSQPHSALHASSEVHLTSLKRMVLDKFRELGFFTTLTNAPFDIVAVVGDRALILTTVSDDPRRLRMRVELIEGASELVGGYGVCISNRTEDSGFPIMKPRELYRIRDPEELFDILSGQ